MIKMICMMPGTHNVIIIIRIVIYMGVLEMGMLTPDQGVSRGSILPGNSTLETSCNAVPMGPKRTRKLMGLLRCRGRRLRVLEAVDAPRHRFH